MPEKFTIFINSYFDRALKHDSFFFLDCLFGVEILSRSLLVECDSYLHCRQLLANLDKLYSLVHRFKLTNIKIYLNKMLYGNLNLSNPHILHKQNMELDITKYQEFIKTVWESDKYMTITNLDNGTVIACTPNPQPDGSIRPTGVGLDARRVWIPKYWEQRNTLLKKCGNIGCYEYEGLLKLEVDDPNCESPKLYPLAIDSQLIEYFGEPCAISTFTYS